MRARSMPHSHNQSSGGIHTTSKDYRDCKNYKEEVYSSGVVLLINLLPEMTKLQQKGLFDDLDESKDGMFDDVTDRKGGMFDNLEDSKNGLFSGVGDKGSS